jgi:uncharacterized protein
MKIVNEFRVSIPIDQAWDVLTDLEGIAPCLPGAQLTGSDGTTFTGKVKVKVGPVTTEYQGTASFAEKDDEARRAVIDAKGRDSRGSGTASAMITAQLRPTGDRTTVSIDTDLKISGKIAQFGSGMIAEVSEKLLGQFVDCLEAKLAAQPAEVDVTAAHLDGGAESSAAHSSGDSGSTSHVEAEPAALDLVGLAGGSIAKRAVPIVVGVIVVGVIIYFATR